ncbi:MAG: MerR family transcriptional regulator [Candidatus Tectimicrobiota bacterium]
MSRTRYQSSPQSAGNVLLPKPFLKIGEVAKLLGLKPHVLRYWEAEFPSLRPKKNPSGQRIYARADVEAIVEIKNLLYNERYTISGAKKMLADQAREKQAGTTQEGIETLSDAVQHLKNHLQELLALLQS